MGKFFVLPPETFERLDRLMESLAKDGAQQKIQPGSARDKDPFIVVDCGGTCSGSCAGSCAGSCSGTASGPGCYIQ